LRILAVVPAYREAERIADVVRRAGEHVPCLVVDDGSPDATAEAARQAGAEVVSHEVNRGKGAALKTGFAWARERGYHGAVTLDGDGQHDPASIPAFVAAAADGADVVVGRRADWAEHGMPWIRRATNRVTSWWVSRLAGCRVTDSQCGYRYISVKAWFDALPATDSYDAESEILIRAGRLGYNVREVPVPTIYAGEVSKIKPVAETLRFVRLVLRYSFRRL
jgi:glycosyltransferase involved in cell wall biosynthesis